MTLATLNERRLSATPRGIAVGFEMYAARGENAELWTEDGRRLIDFGGGIAVLNTGHRHPRITAAIEAQLGRFTHTAYQVMPYASYVELAERINALAPIDGPAKTAFFTTGAEAVENAIKIARAATGRSAAIAFSGAFHGRTMMGMALTGKTVPYKAGFGAMPGEVYHVPFPIPLHGVTAAQSLDAIDRLFKSDLDPTRVAAIIIEPVQGEGGFHPAPAELMTGLRAICDAHGILLIADEVQTGFARTGTMFAMEHYEAKADLITIAKSLAGGMPLSGVVGRAAVMDAPAPGGLGGTYAGNPLAVAAALAVLDVIADEDLLSRAVVLGDRLKARLKQLSNRVPHIAEVRGPGAMIAVEFTDPATGAPDAAFTREVQRRALDGGLLTLTCGTHGNVMRFLFPLTIADATFEEALAILEEALAWRA